MPWVRSLTTWWRWTFGWSNTMESWKERLAALVVLAAFVAAWWWAGVVEPTGLRWAVRGLLAVLLGFALGPAGLKFFGPVLYYEMVRAARRNRYFFLRLGYALLLLFILLLIYLGSGFSRRPDADRATELAMTFFETFMVVQFIAVGLLTPAYVAGAISEEKDRKTLEFLLATDLRNREIVLSKLLARLLNLSMFLLTGLPILAMLQFLGGVDPNLVLAGFAATALTMYGIGGISILCSVQFKRPRDAIAVSYFFVLAYVALSLTLFGFCGRIGPVGGPFRDEPLWWTPTPPTLGDVWWLPAAVVGLMLAFSLIPNLGRLFREPRSVLFPVALQFLVAGAAVWGIWWTMAPGGVWSGAQVWFRDASELAWLGTRGNMAVYLIELIEGMSRGRSVGALVPGMLTEYAVCMGLVGSVTLGWSILRLRGIALKQAFGQTQKEKKRWFGRPPVGDLPMFWKEVSAEGGLRFNWLTIMIMVLLLAASLLPGLLLLWYELVERSGGPGRWFEREMNVWVRLAGTAVLCLFLLAVAVRASTTIGIERDRQTLDSLLTSPLDSTSILAAKLWGSLLSMRFAWIWPGLIWLIGLATGGLHPLALPLVVASWFVFTAFFAMLGLLFSMQCRTTLRATVFTVLTTLGLSVGHWLIWLCCGPLMVFAHDHRLAEFLAQLQAGAFTPPANMAVLAFCSDDMSRGDLDDFGPFLGCSLFGLLLWSAFAAFLWFAVLVPRFRYLTNRQDNIEPEWDEYHERPLALPPPLPPMDEDGEPEPDAIAVEPLEEK